MANKINCMQCIHFYITWDSKFPRGCKLYGFKGKTLPSKTVFEATGKKCESFVPRQKYT